MSPPRPLPASASGNKLRRDADIRAAFARRCSAHGRTVAVHARPRPDDLPARWTVIAGKRVGKAVSRNRAKRRLRGALRAQALPTGFDFVVVAKPGAPGAPFAELLSDLERTIPAAVARCRR